jgi:hypothetical protein
MRNQSTTSRKPFFTHSVKERLMDMSWATPQLAAVCVSIAMIRADWPSSWHDVSMCLSLIASVATLAELGQLHTVSTGWTRAGGDDLVVVSYAAAEVQMVPVDILGQPVQHRDPDKITTVCIHDVTGAEARAARAVGR